MESERKVCPIYSSKLVNTVKGLGVENQQILKRAEHLAYVLGELFWPPPDIYVSNEKVIFNYHQRNVSLNFVIEEDGYNVVIDSNYEDIIC